MTYRMSGQVYYSLFDIDDYHMLITGTVGGFTSLKIDPGKDVLPGAGWIEDVSMFSDTQSQISEYLHGERTTFDINIAPEGTAFQKQVWNALLEIPYGEIKTYGEIAAALGNPKAARAVGMANNKNPLPFIIPCHRVVGADGNLTGYAYGLELKQRLLSMERTISLYDQLFRFYGHQKWWPADNPYEVMTGAVLVQNTAWNNVEKALSRFNGKLSPEYVDSISMETLKEIIRPAGFQTQKAPRLKEITKWFKSYDYSIESAGKQSGKKLRKELLAVHGIGKETADAILLYAFNKPCFIIDAYTRRIFERVGIPVFKDYDQFRTAVEMNIPLDIKIYNEFHALLVTHGKSYCRKNPLCGSCPIKGSCLHGRKSDS